MLTVAVTVSVAIRNVSIEHRVCYLAKKDIKRSTEPVILLTCHGYPEYFRGKSMRLLGTSRVTWINLGVLKYF